MCITEELTFYSLVWSYLRVTHQNLDIFLLVLIQWFFLNIEFGNLRSENDCSFKCTVQISSAVSGFMKLVFIVIIANLINENEMCPKDVNIFNADTSYVT